MQGNPSQHSLKTLLGSAWPQPCPAVPSQLLVHTSGSAASPSSTTSLPQAANAGNLAAYNLSAWAPKPLPIWDLREHALNGGPEALSLPAHRIQQYIGGLQGLQGTFNIHVTR